jgi:hypothetical protein
MYWVEICIIWIFTRWARAKYRVVSIEIEVKGRMIGTKKAEHCSAVTTS